MRADRSIVLSPRKSGTHLVQELMARLGYQTHGESIPARDHAVSLSLRQRIALVDRYLHPHARRELEVFNRFRHRAMAQFGLVPHQDTARLHQSILGGLPIGRVS